MNKQSKLNFQALKNAWNGMTKNVIPDVMRIHGNEKKYVNDISNQVKKDIAKKGIPDPVMRIRGDEQKYINDLLNQTKKGEIPAINTADAMSKHLGIPVDHALKLIAATNKAREVPDRDPRHLIPEKTHLYALDTVNDYADALNLKKVIPGSSTSMVQNDGPGRMPEHGIILRESTHQPENLLKILDYLYRNGAASEKLLIAYNNKAKILNALNKYNRFVPEADLFHEASHINTIPFYPSARWNKAAYWHGFYNTLAPTKAFRPDSYFGGDSGEAMAAANRMKSEMQKLYHLKHGRYPGMDENMEWLQDPEQIKQEMLEASKLWHNKAGNMFFNTPEAKRIRKMYTGALEGRLFMENWFASPTLKDKEYSNILNWMTAGLGLGAPAVGAAANLAVGDNFYT